MASIRLPALSSLFSINLIRLYSFLIFSILFHCCILDAGSFVQPQIFVSSFLFQFFDGDRVIDMNIASTGKATSFESGLSTLFKPNSILMSMLNVFTMVRRPCCWSSSLAKVFVVIHLKEMIQLAALGHIPVSAIVEHQAKRRARAIQRSGNDSESPGKMLHLITICLKEIDPREWLSCRVVLQDFIFSAMNLVIVGHTLYISSVFSTQEWGILSNAFL